MAGGRAWVLWIRKRAVRDEANSRRRRTSRCRPCAGGGGVAGRSTAIRRDRQARRQSLAGNVENLERPRTEPGTRREMSTYLSARPRPRRLRKPRRAFDIVPSRVRRAGRIRLHGIGTMRAPGRRLCQGGAVVAISDHSGWDHHQTMSRSRRGNVPHVDRATARLTATCQRECLYSTLVVMMGAMVVPSASTPRRAADNAKDQSILFAGGGVRSGQASAPTDRQALPPD